MSYAYDFDAQHRLESATYAEDPTHPSNWRSDQP